ncbi:MAG: 3-oxoacid CoA-transferase subunit B [Chloroflexi bacterium]|nr:3-oxoacid CoA-transferase subunit B [Chloroflexota bacterium]
MAERLDEQTMALRVAREFQNGMVVNLGVGTPTLCTNYIPEDREVIFQSENGCLGYGRTAQTEAEQDFNLINASGQFVIGNKGMCFFDHAESFSMIRGGHIDLCVLGGLQVSEKGDLANWLIPGREPGSIGGAMDLAFGAAKLIIVMTHTTRDNEPKILKQCTYALTAPRCVDLVVTDIAVIEVTDRGLVLKETAPGWTVGEVQKLTEPKLIIAPDLKAMAL